MAGYWEIKKVSELGLAYLPLNSIMAIYVKTAAEVAELLLQGWHLCNGTQGTIDLRGSFIRGGHPGANSNVDGGIHRQETTTGSHQLSTGELASHSHSIRASRSNAAPASGGSDASSWDGSVQTGNAGSNTPHHHTVNPTPDHYYVGYFMYLGVPE
jgi:hypothetical protein